AAACQAFCRDAATCSGSVRRECLSQTSRFLGSTVRDFEQQVVPEVQPPRVSEFVQGSETSHVHTVFACQVINRLRRVCRRPGVAQEACVACRTEDIAGQCAAGAQAASCHCEQVIQC